VVYVCAPGLFPGEIAALLPISIPPVALIVPDPPIVPRVMVTGDVIATELLLRNAAPVPLIVIDVDEFTSPLPLTITVPPLIVVAAAPLITSPITVVPVPAKIVGLLRLKLPPENDSVAPGSMLLRIVIPEFGAPVLMAPENVMLFDPLKAPTALPPLDCPIVTEFASVIGALACK
jgi:hypothetical protein